MGDKIESLRMDIILINHFATPAQMYSYTQTPTVYNIQKVYSDRELRGARNYETLELHPASDFAPKS